MGCGFGCGRGLIMPKVYSDIMILFVIDPFFVLVSVVLTRGGGEGRGRGGRMDEEE